MTRIRLYTTRRCAYCLAAKALLGRRGLDYEEIDVSDDAEERERLIGASGGRRTVPQIFIDGKPIGGYAELATLDRTGGLDELLAPSPGSS